MHCIVHTYTLLLDIFNMITYVYNIHSCWKNLFSRVKRNTFMHATLLSIILSENKLIMIDFSIRVIQPVTCKFFDNKVFKISPVQFLMCCYSMSHHKNVDHNF